MSAPQSMTPEHDGPRERVWRGNDRRREPTPRISRFSFLGGRRHRVRREEEREGSFVDRYARGTWIALIWIAFMNALDSFFTLVHLQAGGVELNPVAQALLNTGRLGFVVSKSALIAIPLVILCLHRNFFLARVGLWVAGVTYTSLVIYHLTLF